MLIPCDEVNILNTFRVMIILKLLLLLTNLHLKLLSTQGTGVDKLLSTQRVKGGGGGFWGLPKIKYLVFAIIFLIIVDASFSFRELTMNTAQSWYAVEVTLSARLPSMTQKNELLKVIVHYMMYDTVLPEPPIPSRKCGGRLLYLPNQE